VRLIGSSRERDYSSSEINFLSRMIEGNDVRESRANPYPRKLIKASRENILVFINLSDDATSFEEDRTGKRISLNQPKRIPHFGSRVSLTHSSYSENHVKHEFLESGIEHRLSSFTTVRQWTNLVARPIDLRNVRDVEFQAGDLPGLNEEDCR